MSKFKTGDLVRIVGPSSMEDYTRSPGFYPHMRKSVGLVGTVGYESPSGNYHVLGYYWAPEWLEPLAEPPLGDPVKPEHYRMSDIEPIDAIEAWELGFCLGNVVKYIARHAHKGDPLGDLKKAAWYLDRAIKEMDT